jgi:uncharacterized protein YecE (DUF72 family)
MTLGLFDEEEAAPWPSKRQTKPAKVQPAQVLPAQLESALHELGQQLPRHVYLGTSSWNFPGWAGIVWDEPYAESLLSKQGLTAYSQHPLLRTVSLDRAFYRPMTAQQYAQLAAQVPDDFRFVVKVPSVISDALVRETQGEHAGRGMRANPNFLNAELMRNVCIEPALEGLGMKLGVLVLQMSPVPSDMLSKHGILKLYSALAQVLSIQSAIKNIVTDMVFAVEFRNPELVSQAIQPDLVAMLKECKATYCLGGHAKMPPLDKQLPILRKLWPGPLVARWNLHSKHGRFGYASAKSQYEPFDKLVDEDIATRSTLATVIAGTVKHSQRAFVTINNKAEGSAPLSVWNLAQDVAAQL